MEACGGGVMALSTKQKIVDAAGQILVSEGYRSLSMRRVAAACGISVGNLTYHFPTADRLLVAVIQNMLDSYGEQLKRYETLGAPEGQDILDQVIEFIIRDAVTSTTSSLMIELWAMAKHDPSKAKYVNMAYEMGSQVIKTLILQVSPATSEAVAQKAAVTMLVFSEGSTALFSRQHNLGYEAQDMIGLASQTIRAMIAPAARKSGKRVNNSQ